MTVLHEVIASTIMMYSPQTNIIPTAQEVHITNLWIGAYDCGLLSLAYGFELVIGNIPKNILNIKKGEQIKYFATKTIMLFLCESKAFSSVYKSNRSHSLSFLTPEWITLKMTIKNYDFSWTFRKTFITL